MGNNNISAFQKPADMCLCGSSFAEKDISKKQVWWNIISKSYRKGRHS